MDDNKKLNHYKALKEKHEHLDKKILDAYTHYENDDRVRKMKVEKLLLKEELDRLEKEIKS